MDTKGYEAHPLAEIAPMPNEEELNALAGSIFDIGQLDNIILFNEKILDGRSRYEACKRADVTPTFERFDGTEQAALDFVIAKHTRRNLTPSQKACMAAEVANRDMGDNQYKSGWVNLPTLSNAHASSVFGVSESLIKTAKRIRKEDEELFQRVKAGEFTLNAALDGVKERKQEDVEEEEEEEASVNTEAPPPAPTPSTDTDTSENDNTPEETNMTTTTEVLDDKLYEEIKQANLLTRKSILAFLKATLLKVETVKKTAKANKAGRLLRNDDGSVMMVDGKPQLNPEYKD